MLIKWDVTASAIKLMGCHIEMECYQRDSSMLYCEVGDQIFSPESVHGGTDQTVVLSQYWQCYITSMLLE